MNKRQIVEHNVEIVVENIGGIDETEVDFRPGVNVLTGWNASNRTSLLQAVMAGLGSDQVSLKGDADEGQVEMEIDGVTYTRSIERKGENVVFEGEPYTDDPEPADLFASLLDSNEARQAVARGDDLRQIIMRPVDTESIQAEIERLESRKRDVENSLNERESLVDELSALKTEREELETQISEKRVQFETKREEIDAVDDEFEETRERKAELESKLEDLQERRSTLDDVRYRLETERETAEGIREDLSEVEAELDQQTEIPSAEVERVQERIETLREEEYDEIIDLHTEANALKLKIERLESELDQTEECIEEIGSRLDEREDLEAEREEIQADLEEARTRIEQIEDQAIEEFNDHMTAILDALGYENIERIWIEQVEREVTGLVFALAGYLTHDVHETVPFLLLDSIEAIDSNRIAALVEYFEEYVTYLIVALLPDDAESVDDRYRRITEI